MNGESRTKVTQTQTPNGKASLATKLIKLAEEQVQLLFHDQNGEPWARFLVGDHNEHHPVESRAFKDWISRLLWEKERSAPYSEALRSSLSVIGAKARFDGPCHALNTRITWHDGAIWVDLADGRWRAVRINAEGWEIVDSPPMVFRRFPHQRPVEVGGELDRLNLHGWLNLKGEENHLLARIWLVSGFIPDIPHPVLVLHGPQGSGKTTLAKMLKAIVDPQEAEVISVPRDLAELAQVLAHHHLCALDNLAGLSGWVSDALCRAVSGDGFSKRKLFTDSEDVVFKYQRCVVLNGINVVATRPDLLDRSLILELQRLENAKTEEELWGEFSESLPDIRATIFSTISEAIAFKSKVRLRSLPRMADFAQWGCAVAEAMGIGGDRFLKAYFYNLGHQHEVVIEASSVAMAVVNFMDGQETWEGSPGELLRELTTVAESLGMRPNSRGWPSQPHILTRQLNNLKVSLEGTGIGFEPGQRTSKQRRIRLFRKDREIPSQASQVHPFREKAYDFGHLVGGTCSDDISIETSPLPDASPLIKDDANDDDDANSHPIAKAKRPAQMDLFAEEKRDVIDLRGIGIKGVS